jgi:hypothetical protein
MTFSPGLIARQKPLLIEHEPPYIVVIIACGGHSANPPLTFVGGSGNVCDTQTFPVGKSVGQDTGIFTVAALHLLMIHSQGDQITLCVFTSDVF